MIKQNFTYLDSLCIQLRFLIDSNTKDNICTDKILIQINKIKTFFHQNPTIFVKYSTKFQFFFSSRLANLSNNIYVSYSMYQLLKFIIEIMVNQNLINLIKDFIDLLITNLKDQLNQFQENASNEFYYNHIIHAFDLLDWLMMIPIISAYLSLSLIDQWKFYIKKVFEMNNEQSKKLSSIKIIKRDKMNSAEAESNFKCLSLIDNILLSLIKLWCKLIKLEKMKTLFETDDEDENNKSINKKTKINLISNEDETGNNNKLYLINVNVIDEKNIDYYGNASKYANNFAKNIGHNIEDIEYSQIEVNENTIEINETTWNSIENNETSIKQNTESKLDNNFFTHIIENKLYNNHKTKPFLYFYHKSILILLQKLTTLKISQLVLTKTLKLISKTIPSILELQLLNNYNENKKNKLLYNKMAFELAEKMVSSFNSNIIKNKKKIVAYANQEDFWFNNDSFNFLLYLLINGDAKNRGHRAIFIGFGGILRNSDIECKTDQYESDECASNECENYNQQITDFYDINSIKLNSTFEIEKCKRLIFNKCYLSNMDQNQFTTKCANIISEKIYCEKCNLCHDIYSLFNNQCNNNNFRNSNSISTPCQCLKSNKCQNFQCTKCNLICNYFQHLRMINLEKSFELLLKKRIRCNYQNHRHCLLNSTNARILVLLLLKFLIITLQLSKDSKDFDKMKAFELLERLNESLLLTLYIIEHNSKIKNYENNKNLLPNDAEHYIQSKNKNSSDLALNKITSSNKNKLFNKDLALNRHYSLNGDDLSNKNNFLERDKPFDKVKFFNQSQSFDNYHAIDKEGLLTMNTFSNNTDLLDIFKDQDNKLIDLLLLVLEFNNGLSQSQSIINDEEKNSMDNLIEMNLRQILDTNILFLQFLNLACWHHSLILDLIISPETNFLLYIVKQLKQILSDFNGWKNVCESYENQFVQYNAISSHSIVDNLNENIEIKEKEIEINFKENMSSRNDEIEIDFKGGKRTHNVTKDVNHIESDFFQNDLDRKNSISKKDPITKYNKKYCISKIREVTNLTAYSLSSESDSSSSYMESIMDQSLFMNSFNSKIKLESRVKKEYSQKNKTNLNEKIKSTTDHLLLEKSITILKNKVTNYRLKFNSKYKKKNILKKSGKKLNISSKKFIINSRYNYFRKSYKQNSTFAKRNKKSFLFTKETKKWGGDQQNKIFHKSACVLIRLKLAIENLERSNLLPFNCKPLLNLLDRFDLLYSFENS